MLGQTKSPKELPPIEKKGKFSFKYIIKDIVEFKGWEFIFQVLLYGFLVWGIYNVSVIYTIHTSEEYAHIPKFSVYDFKISFIFVLGFFLYKTIMEKLLINWLKNYFLDPEKFPTEEDKHERAKKACKWIYSIIYYSASTLVCYYLFYDQFFFPSMLGGNGACSNLFIHTPGAPNIPNGKLFYMVQFACHLHTLIDHVVFKWRDPKFWEMFLHHGVAVFLIFFSYMTGEIAVGIMVLFTHDPGDIFLDLIRLYNDYKKRINTVVALIYATFMFVWVYFRLYAFPTCIVSNAFKTLHKRDDWGIFYSPYLYLCVMLSALVALHIYWFFFIIRIAINIVTKKKEYNSYDKKKAG